jgi:hypothetical protein
MRGPAARLAVAAVMVMAACSSGEGTDGPPTAQARPSSDATLAILEPQPGDMVPGGDVTVRLELDGGRITEQVTTNLRPDEGHIHLKLDGRTITLLGSLDEVVPDVPAGQHVLEAEFVAADHGPFDPRVLSTVTFTVP